MGKKKKGQEQKDGGGRGDDKTSAPGGGGGGGDGRQPQPGPSGRQQEPRPSIGPGGDGDNRGQKQKSKQHQGGQPQQQQQGPPQQQQQQRGGQPQQQQQRGGQPQQQQQRGGQPQQQQQRGGQPQQQQQRGGQPQQQQQRGGPPQQQQQRGGQPPQQQQPSWQQQGPPQQQQPAWQQQGPPQQQRGGPPQQQQQRGGQPPQQQQPSWQQQGPSQQQQPAWQQQGPPQQQRGGPPQQQQQRGGQPQQQQQRGGPPQQQQQRGGQPQQQQRGGQPQQQQQQPGPSQQQRGDQPQQQSEEKKRHDWKKKDKRAELASPMSPPTTPISGSSSTQSLASQASRMSVKSAHVCLDRGTKGRRVVIETNYVDLLIHKIINSAFQYDIKFEPDKPKRFMRQAFEEFRTANILIGGRPVSLAFDGKSIVYSPIRLPDNLASISAEVNVVEPESGQTKVFKVTLKETVDPEIELSSLKTYQNLRVFDKPMRAIQCLDVVLRSPCYASSVQAGRSFYTPPSRPIDLRDGYELWYGLFQAAVLGETPLLNIDIAHKSFPSARNVVQLISEMRNANVDHELDDRNYRELSSFLKGLIIVYKPPDGGNSKRYKFNSLKDSCEKQTFVTGDNKKMTVSEYFRTKNYQLQYPKMPCLHVGSTTRNIYLPAELCEVAAGQATMKKAGTNQVRELIRHAAVSTIQRKEKIMSCFQQFRHANDPTIREFGLGIGQNFLNVDARIISAPQLKYGSADINPRKGSWRAENVKFLQSSNLIKWAILSTDRGINDFDIRRLGDEVSKLGSKLNMNIDPNYAIIKETNPRYFDDKLSGLKKNQCQLVFVVLSFPDSYAQIKQSAEIRNGILTQCIKSETLKRRLNASTINNILLKVNAKLNGTNHKIHDQNKTAIMSDDNVMFLGADVTHPSPDQRTIPSVVGVAASHDKNGFQYNMRWRLQDPKKEIIDDMENILKEQLEFYKRKCQKYPSKIMYYRDGVSDGQFEFVRRTELTAMDRAIKNIQPKPKITCIVVQKRHHTRFFPIPGTGVGDDDRFKNVPPGTIVDTKITHPNESQFFLVSHESIQGTAKPTKYCIIRDDSNLNIDDLQAITYNLCHMFSRCNRSVSYPAPAYNAHLAAARGKVYIEQRNPLNMRNLDNEYRNRQIKENIINENPMFFV